MVLLMLAVVVSCLMLLLAVSQEEGRIRRPITGRFPPGRDTYRAHYLTGR